MADPRLGGQLDGLAAAQRRAWRAVTADQRLQWLEDALAFAAQAGALDRDRRRRARDAVATARAMGLDSTVPS